MILKLFPERTRSFFAEMSKRVDERLLAYRIRRGVSRALLISSGGLIASGFVLDSAEIFAGGFGLFAVWAQYVR